jgi:C4-dicarboxylate-specific signal transduction histidine kinase
MSDSTLEREPVTVNNDLPESVDLSDVLGSLDRAALWRSLVRGVAHDLNNTSQVFTLNEPEDIVDQVRTGEWNSTANWITSKLGTAIELLQEFGEPAGSELEPVVVGDVIATVLEWQRYQKAQPPVPVRVDVAPDTRPASAVAAQLRHVLLSLLANAKEAMGESDGGEIVVSAASANSGTVLIAVEDAGPGIPIELQDKIFEPFYTTKSDATHAGLGATVSRQLVESWAGSLSAECRDHVAGAKLLVRLKEWSSTTA